MPFCRRRIAQGELHLRHQGMCFTLMGVNPKSTDQMSLGNFQLLSRKRNLSKPELRERIIGLEDIRAG